MSIGSSHVFSEIFLHVNWHCKQDHPLITPEIEPFLLHFLEDFCRQVKGVHYQAVGCTHDHIHLVFQLEPFVLLSDFVGKIKGASSHAINIHPGPERIEWQRGYGAVSFSKKHLSSVIQYVESQKEHHRKGTVNPVLETTGERETALNVTDS